MPVASEPAQFGAYIDRELTRFAPIIKAAGLRADTGL